jgi:hypothetical protein
MTFTYLPDPWVWTYCPGYWLVCGVTSTFGGTL